MLCKHHRTAAIAALWLVGSLSLAGGLGCVGAIGGSSGPGGAEPGPARPGGPGSPTSPGGPQGGPGGTGGGPGPATSSPPATGPVAAVPGRLRRLTRPQLEQTLADLLGGPVALGQLEPDDQRDGFASLGASYSVLSPRGAEQYETALLAVLGQIMADPTRRAGLLAGSCLGQRPDDQACLQSFVERFGLRAWRRPLTPAEVDRYSRLAAAIGTSYGDRMTGLVHALSGLLASPNFLYRVEIGKPDPGAGGRFRFDGWEMASRLSFFLWNSGPDAALLESARSGELDREAGVRAQAERLLASPRAPAGLASFGRELLELDKLAESPKPDPRYTPALQAAMVQEITRLFESRLGPGADLLELLDGEKTFVDAELARLYGITGVTGTAAVAASLPRTIPRVGVLGTAAFLALTSPQTETSPTSRGVFVNERMLCRHIPEPPDNVDTNLPDPPPGAVLTKRERLDGHRGNPACAGCHALFDPIGYAFEHFDWIGGYRTKEPNGKTIDATGSFEGRTFSNARELAAILRALPDTRGCLMRNLFRVATGHRETEADDATVAAWDRALGEAGGELARTLPALLAGDGFRFATPTP